MYQAISFGWGAPATRYLSITYVIVSPEGKNFEQLEDIAHRLLRMMADRGGLWNNRPLCLSSVLDKISTKVTLKPISSTLDEAQPQEETERYEG